jgi:hypothetical protein
LRNRGDIWSVKPDAGEAVFPQVAAFTRVCLRLTGRAPRAASINSAAAIRCPCREPKELAGYKELETIDFDVSFDQMRTAAKAMPLPPIPFIVISKGKREEPQLVIDAIRQMVEAARAETPPRQGGFLVRLPRIG